MKSFLSVVLLAFTFWWGWSSFQSEGELHAQNSLQMNDDLVEQHLREFLEMRKKMMQDFDQDFDQFFPPHSFGPGNKGLSLQGDFFGDSEMQSGVSYDWEETNNERILIIKPANKNIPVDINIKNEQIEIKGKYVLDEENKSGQMKSKKIYRGEFTNLLPLPVDVDGKKAKIESRDGDILVKLPKISGKVDSSHLTRPLKEDKVTPTPRPLLPPDRKPLRPDEGDITI